MPTVRSGFIGAARGRLRLDHASLHYVSGKQQLRLTGWHNDGPPFGVPFALVSKPFDGDPVMRAAQMATDLISAYQGKPMSLLGKMNALTESAADFNTKTGAALDELQARLPVLAKKRDDALVKHHSYYDGLEKSFDDTAAVIDKLSNGPLGEGSGS